MFLKLYSWGIILSIFNGTPAISGKTTSHKTTVVGIALNDKGSAIVETDQGD